MPSEREGIASGIAGNIDGESVGSPFLCFPLKFTNSYTFTDAVGVAVRSGQRSRLAGAGDAR